MTTKLKVVNVIVDGMIFVHRDDVRGLLWVVFFDCSGQKIKVQCRIQ